jgi:hypothetical protein
MPKAQPEYELQKAVCQYLELQYPDVLFLSDTGSGIKLTMPQAIRNKQIQKKTFKMPDLVVFEPRGGWHGLFLELKAVSPYRADNTLKNDSHILAQYESMTRLSLKQYYAEFVWTFDQAKQLIDWYLTENYEKTR